MPVPSSITDLDTVAANNSPAGSDSVGVIDDHLRAHSAFIRQLYNSYSGAVAGGSFTYIDETQTATDGQTVFTLSSIVYSPGTNSIAVYVDGLLVNDYTETNASTVTFQSGLLAGQEVTFIVGRHVTSGLDAGQVAWSYSETYGSGTIGAKAQQVISVVDFGAVGDGVTDDTAAFTAALAYAATDGLRITVPPGYYLISSALTFPSTKGVELVGTGQSRESATPYPVELRFSHTSGPAVRIYASGQAIKDMVIRSTGARSAAPYDASCPGVLVEGPDTSSGYISNSLIENVFISGHPGSGLVYSGQNFMNKFNGIAVRDCHGHALYISDGTITGRTNKGRPGGFIGSHLRTYKNDGHDIVITPMPEANDAYRVHIVDGDLSSRDGGAPAIPVGIKLADATCVIHGENINLVNLAFGGRVSGTATYTAVDAAGRNHRYVTCRWVGVVGLMNTRVGSLGTTDDLMIDSPYITSDSTLSPAVVIGSGVGTVTILSRNQSGTGVSPITNPFTTGYAQGIFINSAGITAPSFTGNGANTAAVKVTRDGAVCGFEVERTGSGAATGKLQASGSQIQVGSTSSNDVVILRNSTTRVTVKSNTINIASLPTSSAGLSSGDLWNDAGTLKVA